MVWLFLIVLGPVVAGIILALAWWAFLGRKRQQRGGGVSAFSMAAGLLLGVGGVFVLLFGSPLLPFQLPREYWYWYQEYRFTAPLLLGILGMVLLAFPVQSRSGRGTADLIPRTPLSFARGWWFVAPALLLALILTVTVTAGVASQPDPSTGRYTMYLVDLGGERQMGASIYGWYNSIPSLILMAVMLIFAIVNLVLIARPALVHDREEDVRIRIFRTRNVLAIGTSALLTHLGFILGSLAGTASIRSSFRTSEGSVTFWTTFAGLQPIFVGASAVAAALGFALCVAVALAAIPSRRWAPAKVSTR
ncbi:hypothetical protein [Cryobacterium sp. Y82]|uniref:hypothetical protein n=1 Tax=Cryobacterium sp. Y82 TaxID=2045017 RepID=UPI000CE3FE1A|nr:hypothetical protein [Cryobacterium sp. Y82]